MHGGFPLTVWIFSVQDWRARIRFVCLTQPCWQDRFLTQALPALTLHGGTQRQEVMCTPHSAHSRITAGCVGAAKLLLDLSLSCIFGHHLETFVLSFTLFFQTFAIKYLSAPSLSSFLCLCCTQVLLDAVLKEEAIGCFEDLIQPYPKEIPSDVVPWSQLSPGCPELVSSTAGINHSPLPRAMLSSDLLSLGNTTEFCQAAWAPI